MDNLYYNTINVSDVIEQELDLVSKLTFKPAYIFISKHCYEINYTIYNGITYLSSSIQYYSYEFETIFGFKSNCSNFYKGKIIKINYST